MGHRHGRGHGAHAPAATRLRRYATWPLRWLFAVLGRFIPRPTDPSDFLITVRAEEAFDVGARLGEIGAPTLVVAGARDPFYSPALFRATANGIPGARLVLLPRGGHVPTGPDVEQAIGGIPRQGRQDGGDTAISVTLEEYAQRAPGTASCGAAAYPARYLARFASEDVSPAA